MFIGLNNWLSEVVPGITTYNDLEVVPSARVPYIKVVTLAIRITL